MLQNQHGAICKIKRAQGAKSSGRDPMMDYIFNIDILLPFSMLRAIIAVLGTSAAAYFDLWNNRNIPNSLLYAFLGIAVIFDIATMPMPTLIYAGAVALVVALFGFVLYRMGQLGGADVFIIASIALLLPVQPQDFLVSSMPPFAFPFILSVLFVAGISFMLMMLATNVLPAFDALRKGKIRLGTDKYLYVAVIVACYIAFTYFAGTLNFFEPLYFAIFTLLLASSAFFIVFRELIIGNMVEMVPLSKIDEEDVLCLEKMDQKLVAKYGLARVLTLSELKRMKKFQIRKYPVFKRMPVFVPYILFGLLVSLVLGDLLLLTMKLSI